MNARFVAAGLVLASGTLTSFPSKATYIEASGAEACQGVTSSDALALRRTFNGLQNDSSSVVHVMCSVATVAQHVAPNDSQRFSYVHLVLDNPTGRVATIKCNLATSITAVGDNVYFPGQLTLQPNTYGVLRFHPDTGRFPQFTMAVACALPPHGCIRRLRAEITEFQFIPME